REDAELLAGSRPADRIRHVNAGPLLPHDDGPDTSGGGAFDDVVDRIGGQNLNALALEDFPNRVEYLHGLPPCDGDSVHRASVQIRGERYFVTTRSISFISPAFRGSRVKAPSQVVEGHERMSDHSSWVSMLSNPRPARIAFASVEPFEPGSSHWARLGAGCPLCSISSETAIQPPTTSSAWSALKRGPPAFGASMSIPCCL